MNARENHYSAPSYSCFHEGRIKAPAADRGRPHVAWIHSVQGVAEILTKEGHRTGDVLISFRLIESVCRTCVLSMERSVDSVLVTMASGAMYHLIPDLPGGREKLLQTVENMIVAANK